MSTPHLPPPTREELANWSSHAGLLGLESLLRDTPRNANVYALPGPIGADLSGGRDWSSLPLVSTPTPASPWRSMWAEAVVRDHTDRPENAFFTSEQIRGVTSNVPTLPDEAMPANNYQEVIDSITNGFGVVPAAVYAGAEGGASSFGVGALREAMARMSTITRAQEEARRFLHDYYFPPGLTESERRELTQMQFRSEYQQDPRQPDRGADSDGVAWTRFAEAAGFGLVYSQDSWDSSRGHVIDNSPGAEGSVSVSHSTVIYPTPPTESPVPAHPYATEEEVVARVVELDALMSARYRVDFGELTGDELDYLHGLADRLSSFSRPDRQVLVSDTIEYVRRIVLWEARQRGVNLTNGRLYSSLVEVNTDGVVSEQVELRFDDAGFVRDNLDWASVEPPPPVFYYMVMEGGMQEITPEEVALWTGQSTSTDSHGVTTVSGRAGSLTPPPLYPGVQKPAWSDEELRSRQSNPTTRSDLVDTLIGRLREVLAVRGLDINLVRYTLNASAPVTNSCRSFSFRILQRSASDGVLVEAMTVRIFQKYTGVSSSDWAYNVSVSGVTRVSRPLRPYVSSEAAFRGQQAEARRRRTSGEARDDAAEQRRREEEADREALARVARARARAAALAAPVPPPPPPPSDDYRAGIDL